jgi:addiction module HigA family antidote
MKNPTIPVEHPGIILKEEFLNPYEITSIKLAEEIGVSEINVEEIIRGRKSISSEIGLKMAKFFGLSERYFIDLQAEYDFRIARENVKDVIDKIKTIRISA